MARGAGELHEARIELAQFTGITTRIRDRIWQAPPELVAHHRREWPDLWAALDDLLAHVDEVHPPFGRPPPA